MLIIFNKLVSSIQSFISCNASFSQSVTNQQDSLLSSVHFDITFFQHYLGDTLLMVTIFNVVVAVEPNDKLSKLKRRGLKLK